MVKRVNQQVRVTKIMIDAVDLYALPPEQKKLAPICSTICS